MRTPLRSVVTPGEGLVAALDADAAARAAADDESYDEPPPADRLLYSRATLTTASSEHGSDVPSTAKAKARRLAAMIHVMHHSRPHGHNAPLSRLATAN